MVTMRGTKFPHYIVYIPTEGKDHFMAYNPTMGMYYITSTIYSAEKFLTSVDAVASFKEYCDIHVTHGPYPEYAVIGMNTLVTK